MGRVPEHPAMTPREMVLEFIDAVMARTVAAHEDLCSASLCSVEDPCAYCKVNETLMEELGKMK